MHPRRAGHRQITAMAFAMALGMRMLIPVGVTADGPAESQTSPACQLPDGFGCRVSRISIGYFSSDQGQVFQDL